MSFKNFSLTLLSLSSFFFPYGNSLFFNISHFDKGSNALIEQQGDAIINAGRIKLTNTTIGSFSKGRALYKEEVILWDEESGELADFTTHFSFIIKCVNGNYCGDGFTFFLAKHTATIPKGSEGGQLALYGPDTDFSKSENGVVAVEFDTFKNAWDPSADHVGIDVNSIISIANITWDSSMKDGRTANAWVTYNSSTHNLSVFLTYDKHPIYRGNSSLSHNVNLRDVLSPKVAIGFSGSTGLWAESHEIISWSFSSKLHKKTETPKIVEPPAEAPEQPGKPEKSESPKSPKIAESSESPKTPESPETPQKTENSVKTNRSNVGLLVGLAVLVGTILII